uniref:J domain-containing protein n=51 Tax=Neoaves TaxID=3078114 RepID=U3JEF3_FICAL
MFVTGIVCSTSLYWHILIRVVSWFVHVQTNVITLDSFCLRLIPFSQKSLKYTSSFTMILIARSFFLQLSILVHPDKNQDDADRAQKAFEAVDKAYKLLLDQEQKKRALDVIQAGKEYVEHTVKEKKKQLKKDGKPPTVEEDDPEVFKQAVYKQTMKLFAELEIKRKEREAKEMHERKRQREEEIEAQEKAKREREWQKNFEESRDGRVDSWRNFQANTKGKKEKKNRTFLRPPKVKMEQRE